MQSQEFKDNTTIHDAPMMSITLYENRGVFVDIQYSNVPKSELETHPIMQPPQNPHPVYGPLAQSPLSKYVNITQGDTGGAVIDIMTS